MKLRLLSLLTTVAVIAGGHDSYSADSDLDTIKAEITKRHDEAVKRLQDWIGQVSIAAEDRGYPEGAEYMAKLARDAGFQQATVLNTDGKPGVFATLDASAPKTVGLYFMYDVKQFDPAEWTSPPTEARIVDKPPLGKVIVGRGAVNQKGPRGCISCSIACDSRCGKENAGELGDGSRRRRGDRFPAHPATRQATGSIGGAKEMCRRLHALCIPGFGWSCYREPWGKGRHRTGADFERRKMGTRSCERHSFIAQSDGG